MVNKKEKSNFFKMTKRPNLDERLLINFFDKTKYRAIIFNENGEQVGTVKLDRSKQGFKFKDGQYNIKWDCKTHLKRENFFHKFKYFMYIFNNPDPIEFDNEKNNFQTIFNAEQYNVMLETDIARKLNNLVGGLGQFLTGKNILIMLGVGAVAYYFLSGGTLM